ncbi:class E sortase [Candidatus Peregrinibacteria bacterium]|nr:class E sortase [Candidatus Peregrinibacteria bacterium]
MKYKVKGGQEKKTTTPKKAKKEVFSLHVESAKPPSAAVVGTQKKIQKFHFNFQPKAHFSEPKKEKISEKIWSIARFVSTSAIIFIILFFLMNWNAYQQIIMHKLGFSDLTPEQQEILERLPVSTDSASTQNGASQTPQEIMDLSKNPDVQKTQIPPLNIEVFPPDSRVVIPRISKNVPVVTVSSEALINKEWDKLEQQIQVALQDGVVHYPGTAFPDENGNVVITGHSSYFVWDPGRFKDVFALLHQVQMGDRVYLFYKQKRYVYEVYDIKVVLPTQVDVLTQQGEDKLTLITCTPVGTNLKRLVVVARPV